MNIRIRYTRDKQVEGILRVQTNSPVQAPRDHSRQTKREIMWPSAIGLRPGGTTSLSYRATRRLSTHSIRIAAYFHSSMTSHIPSARCQTMGQPSILMNMIGGSCYPVNPPWKAAMIGRLQRGGTYSGVSCTMTHTLNLTTETNLQ